jgi:glycosyltransferase involved in cell wall biosynthesis
MSQAKAGLGLKLIAAPESAPAGRTRVAIVIPAFNEEKNIEAVLREIAALRTQRPDWELIPIVVNDGSRDGTAEVLSRVAPVYGAQVITLPLNLGIGRAVQTGLIHAMRLQAQVTLQLDGDGQHPADQIPLIVEPVLQGRADVAVGSRYLRGASGNVSSGWRQAGTWFFSLLLRAVVGVRIKDTTSGFRAFNAEATEFLSRHYPDDYPEVEAYVPLARGGFRIAEEPVRMRPRHAGRSSITFVKGLYYMAKVGFATVIGTLRPRPPRRRK